MLLLLVALLFDEVAFCFISCGLAGQQARGTVFFVFLGGGHVVLLLLVCVGGGFESFGRLAL